jgi:hypothetical protein
MGRKATAASPSAASATASGFRLSGPAATGSGRHLGCCPVRFRARGTLWWRRSRVCWVS